MIIQKKTPSGYIYKLDKDFLLKELKMGYLFSYQNDRQADQVINQMTNQKNRRAIAGEKNLK